MILGVGGHSPALNYNYITKKYSSYCLIIKILSVF